jgi:hypothetical protein
VPLDVPRLRNPFEVVNIPVTGVLDVVVSV